MGRKRGGEGGFGSQTTARQGVGVTVGGGGGRSEVWYFIEFPPPLISKAVNSHLDILHPVVVVVVVVLDVVVLCLTNILLPLSFRFFHRILPLTSRRSSTKNTIPHGIALLGATLGRM